MGYLKERICYIKGLADGLEVDTSSKEGKLLHALIEFCEAAADAFDDLDNEQSELIETCQVLEDRVSELEDADLYDDDDDDDIVELTCPKCGETIFFDHDLISEGEEVVCPGCNTVIVSNIDNLDDDV